MSDQNTPPDAPPSDVPVPLMRFDWLARPVEQPAAPPDLRAYAAAARFARETAGVVVGNAPIATDRDSQALIDGLWIGAQIDPGAAVQFKTSAGYIALSAAQIVTIATAVKAHVQACRTAEQTLDAGIAAGTVTTAAEVDAAFAAVAA